MFLQETPAEPAESTNVAEITNQFVEGIVGSVPRLLTGILFLVVVYLLIKLVLRIVRSVFERLYPADEQLIVDLAVAVVGIFLWFAAALGLLKILGLGEVAASLGTASGFIGLGIAFALKEMIADTVAGVYLLQDDDFEEGDYVDTASVTGTVSTIDLRKTRIRKEDGDLVVVANREVEKRWTRENPETAVGVESQSSA